MVAPVCCMCWKKFGKELKIANGILNSIDFVHSEKSTLWCCKTMFSTWLSLNIPKSWNNILQAITSPEISKKLENTCYPLAFHKIRDTDKVLCSLACKIQTNAINLRYTPPSDNWPITKPKHFTSVAIIHHKKGIRKEIVKLIAEIQQEGIERHSDGMFSNIKDHKDLSNLFVNEPKHVLIEGAPGIGKTTLAEEIVFQWSLGNLLEEKRLLLLVNLRDPVCQNIITFRDLIKHCISYTESKSTKISIIENYIIENQGEKVALVLDGYDELPVRNIRNNEFFINKIINKGVGDFSKGMLIVTSRPNVSVHLHDMIDRRVEILGFTEANRMEYITQALKGNKNDIQILQNFLRKNPTINSYCYIPLNMAMLLYLFNEVGSESNLPTTQTGINKLFICHTISRYIQNTCVMQNIQQVQFTGTDFSKIPTPYSTTFQGISAYSFHTLKDEKIVFEKNEIEKFCPNLTLDPNTWNGLGLLKAVQLKYSIIENDETVSFNFLHLSIQEMLAAYHVTSLPDRDQITLLEKTFWDPKYYNMWIMYVGLTKGKSFPFKHFLSGNSWQWLTRRSIRKKGNVSISHNIIADRIKCLYLFQCFSEAEDTEMCKYVGQLLQDGDIDLSKQLLNPVQINTLGVFLTQTNIKQWQILNLSKCYLEDDGFSRLYASISGSNRSMMHIRTLDLSFNYLTETSTSSILSLVMAWNVRNLDITSNDISFSAIINELISSQEFKQNCMEIYICSEKERGLIVSNKAYDKIVNLKSCTRIFLCKCNLGNKDKASDNVLSLLKNGKEVYLYDNNLPFKCLVKNIKELKDVSFHYLSEVDISKHEINETANELMLNMSCALKFDEHNSLPLHIYNVSSHNVALVEELLSQKNFCGIILFSCLGEHIGRVFAMLQSNKTVKHISLTDYNMDAYDINFNIASTLKQHQLSYLDISSTCITSSKLQDLAEALSGLGSLKSLNLSNCKFQNDAMLEICKALTNIKNVSYLNLSSNNINNESAKFLVKFTTINKGLQAIELFNCNLNEEGVVVILMALQQNQSLIKLNLGANVISDEATEHLAALIINNSSLTHLYLKECGLRHVELKFFTDALAKSQLFIEFDFSFNMFSDQNCKDIAYAVSLSKKVKHLDLSCCNLKEEGMMLLSSALCDTECLVFLNLDGNHINDSAANNIAVAFHKHTKLEFLSLSKCILSDAGLKIIMQPIKELQNLKYLDVSYIEIRDQVVLNIAAIIDVNRNLEYLNFAHCRLQADQLVTALKAINKLEMLKYLNLSNNLITIEAANELAAFISKNNSLEHLHISNCKFNEEGLLIIAKKVKLLNTFDISSNIISSEAVSKLSQIIVISQFKHFSISNCCIKEKFTLLCQAITKNGCLKCINFGGIAMNDTEAKHLGQAIRVNNFVEKLILSNCKLNPTGLMYILDAMKKMIGIKYLDLMSNEIDDESVMMLAQIVNNNAMEYLDISDCLHRTDVTMLLKEIANKGTFIHINLSCNSIGNAYANGISDVISVNHNLQCINLSSNNFTAAGTKIILNGMGKTYSLKSVELENYEITIDELKSIIMNNRRLKFIKLRKLLLNYFQMKASFAHFKGLILLKELCIEGSKLGNSEVKLILTIISTNPHVQSVSLVNCIFSTFELKIDVFNSLCSLRRLHCFALKRIDNVNEIQDQLVAVMNNNRQLKHLEIAGSKLTENIILNIFRNVQKLSHLNVSNSNLTTEIVTKAVLHVVSNPVSSESCKSEANIETNQLKYIDISCNPFSNIGINAFEQTMMASPSLEYVNVSSCLLNSKGINSIIKAISKLTSLKYLDLSLNSLTDEQEFNIEIVIKNNKELEYLYLPNCTLTPKKLENIFYALQTISMLRNLDIDSNIIDNQLVIHVAAVIQNNKNLKRLSLSEIILYEESFKAFNNGIRILHGLKCFNVVRSTFTDQETDDLLVAMLNSENLEKINLQFCLLSDKNKVKIFDCLKNLTTLKYFNISGIVINLQAEHDIAAILEHNTKLEHLEMEQCGISKSLLKKISPICSNLLHINFSNNKSLCHMGGIIASLITMNTELSHVNFGNCQLVADDVHDVSKALQNLSSLQHIDLTLNSMTDELSGDMAAIVVHNKNLEKILFPMAKLNFKSIKIITKAMSQITSLTHVDLNVNKVDESVARDIAKFLENNHEIIEVRFSKLQLHHNGHKLLGRYLEKFKGLKYISITNSKPSVTTLQKLIRNNDSIEHLSLSKCDISIHEMIILSQILQYVNSLHYLDFSHIYIDDPQVVENIMNTIYGNNKLKYLKLSGCSLNAFHITNITTALKLCNKLVLLNLSHCNDMNLNTIKNLTDLLKTGSIQYLFLEDCSLNSNDFQNIITSLNIGSTLKHNSSKSLKLLDIRCNDMKESCSLNEIDSMINMILKRKLKSVLLPNFDDSKLQLLVIKLREVNSLQYLDFGSNYINDDLAGKVVTLITSNNYLNLEQLRISKLWLNQNDLICLSNNSKLNIRSISYVTITDCLFNVKTWNFLKNLIVKNTNSVTELIFIGCTMPASIGKVLRSATKLQQLQLNSITVQKYVQGSDSFTCSLTANSEIFVEPLCYIRKLLSLNLSHNNLSGKAAEQLVTAIALFTTLECLVLANCRLTAKEIKHFQKLCSLRKLKHIDLSCNAITDEEVATVAMLISTASELQHLNLSNCEFQSNGIYVITDMLKENTKLKHLDLSSNGIVGYENTSTSGTKCIDIFAQIIDLMLRSSNMEHLKLPEVFLLNNQLKHLLEIATLKKSYKCIGLGQNTVNEKLADDFFGVFSDGLLEQMLINNVDLKQKFSYCKDILPKIQGLLNLSINYCDLTNDDVFVISSTIAKNNSIQRFDLRECTSTEVSDENKLLLFEALSRISSLEYLSIYNFNCTEESSMSLAKVIAYNNKLSNIELQGCNFGNEGCRSVLNTISMCKDVVLLNLSYNVNVGMTEFKIFNGFMNKDKLAHVNVTACNFEYATIIEFCEVLHDCKNLKYLDLSHNSIVGKVPHEISSSIFLLTNLEYLNLCKCQLVPNGIKIITSVLKNFNTLKYVYLNLNKMAHDAVDNLAYITVNNKNMRNFALPEYDESFVGIEVILNAMKSNSSLQYLDISCAKVLPKAAIELVAVLDNNPKLEHVVLNHLTLDPKAFIKLSPSLSKIRELRYLAITLSSVNDESAGNVTELIINNPTIQTLNLSGCIMSTQGKLCIFRALISLKALQLLNVNNIVIEDQLANDLITMLSRNVSMRHLEMEKCATKLTEHNIYKLISSFKNLIHLNFNNNMIFDIGLSHLSNVIKEIKSEHLELSKCNITSLDTVLKFLSINTLKYLDLSYNPISNIVITIKQHMFTGVSYLTYLNLFRCKMPEEGTEQVIKYLTKCRLLTHLDLSSNLLNPNSSAVCDLSTIISKNKLIENLYLPTCTLSDLNIKPIFQSLRNISSLKFIDLDSNRITNEMAGDVAAIVINNCNLHHLKCSMLELEESGFEALKFCLLKIKALNHLSITGCKISDENAEIIYTLISNNLSIQELTVHNCVPTCTKNLQLIFSTIRNLKLEAMYFVYSCLAIPLNAVIDDLLIVIRASVQLEAIGLGGCALSQENIIAILNKIKYPRSITHFKLEETFLSTQLITVLLNLQLGTTGLEQLTLCNCKITGEEVSNWLRITDMSKLRHLDVSSNPISMQGGKAIQNVIINTKELQYIKLSGCMLQPEQLDQIIVQLKVISSLLYLNISDNSLSDEIVLKLKDVIINNTAIEHLSFSNCNLNHSRVTVLLNAIKNNSHVKCIDISLNETKNKFNKELMDVANSNQFLEFIMLSKLELGQHELQLFSQILPLIGKLEHFTIIGGSFTHNNACNVATLIGNNRSLKYLKISDCVISDTEKLTVFIAMKNVTELTHLFLNNIAITGQVKEEISTVIANNPGLQHIEMTGCLNISFVRSFSTLTSNHKHITCKNIN